MKEPKGNSKTGRISVSLDPDAAKKLMEMKESMAKRLGFVPSYTQIVEYLINNYTKESQ